MGSRRYKRSWDRAEEGSGCCPLGSWVALGKVLPTGYWAVSVPHSWSFLAFRGSSYSRSGSLLGGHLAMTEGTVDGHSSGFGWCHSV